MEPIRESNVPACGIHLRLAAVVLESWDDRPGASPFPVADAAARCAFFCGANAPDMGYYPRGEPLLTDFSHYIRSADLARAMLAAADGPAQTAFAWGWVTHILGDALVHPLVNQAAGELMRGSRDQPMNYYDDPVAHVRVEIGLDGFLLVSGDWRFPELTSGHVDAGVINLLDRAYRSTYGVSFDHRSLRASYGSLMKFVPRLLEVDQIIGAKFHGQKLSLRRRLMAGLAFLPIKLFARSFHRKSFLYALTHTVSPSVWFVEEVSEVIRSFPERFQELVDDRIESLVHYNLDLGVVEGDPPTYPLAVKAISDLQTMRDGDARVE